MPFPFPGMNPYLEQEDVWQDFHQSFILLARKLLTEQVRPAYVVKVLTVTVDIERHSYLEIRDRRGRELITAIELLSPSNKRFGPDREQYLSKRLQFLHNNVHLVEIDLLRGGPRLPVEGLVECDYCALVSRWEDRSRTGVWPIRLREPLPVLPIPLRAPDPNARLDMQEVLHRVYDDAGYADYIYTGTPQPPLAPEDDTGARQCVPAT